MNFSVSEEQEALRNLAQQIFSDRMTEDRHKALRAEKIGFDRELWRELAKANLLGLCLPEASDGMGLGMLELGLVLEAQGRSLAPVPLATSIALAALPIARFGSEEQKARLLPGFAGGELLLSAAFHELAVGEVTAPAARAEADGSDWLLSGTKVCVPIADVATRIVVPARTGDGRGDVGVFLVDPGAAGVKLEPQTATNGESQFQLRLEGVVVPAADVLGDPRAGGVILHYALDRGLAAFSALQLGVMDESLARTAAYTTNRKQFGKPIGAFQAVQLRAADGYIDSECLRSTLWQALWELDEGRPASKSVAVAKWWACIGGQRVVHTALHLHGGTGADVDYPIHRFFFWAKQIELSLGGSAQQLERIGAELVA